MTKGTLKGVKCHKCGAQVMEDEPLETEHDLEIMEGVNKAIFSCPKCHTEIRQTKAEFQKRIKRNVEFT